MRKFDLRLHQNGKEWEDRWKNYIQRIWKKNKKKTNLWKNTFNEIGGHIVLRSAAEFQKEAEKKEKKRKEKKGNL